MKTSFRLGTICGVPVEISYPWLVVFLLAAAALAHYVIPALRPSWSTQAYWVTGLCTSFLFFASLLIHELAHSVTAVRQGIPVRGVSLSVLGGVTRLAHDPDSPRAEAAVAAAGPLASIALGGTFAALWLLGDDASEHAGAVGLYLFGLNLTLAALDMLPALPLDGGRVLRSIIWRRTGDYDGATRVALRAGNAFGAALLAGGVIVGVAVYWFSGICVGFLGVFLLAASWVSQRQAALRRAVRGLAARDLMVVPRMVSATTKLEELASGMSSGAGDTCLLVGSPGGAEGIVCSDQIEDVPRRKWPATSVAEIMSPLAKVEAVGPDDSGLSVLEKIEEARYGLVVVVAGGQVLGLITCGDLRSRSAERAQDQKGDK
jgi:Zn-dependent protease